MSNIQKIGTILAVFAMIASSLLVSMPVGAVKLNKGTDIYVASITLPATQPAMGDNISINAIVKAGQLAYPINPATNQTWVNFTAVNGSTLIAFGVKVPITSKVTQAGWQVNTSWNSMNLSVMPDPFKDWSIKVDVWMHGTDVNLTNNTKTSATMIHWRLANLIVNNIVNATTGNTYLIGDAFTCKETVKNIGDADLMWTSAIDLYAGANMVNETTVSTLAAGASLDLTATVNKTTTGGFTAGKTVFSVKLDDVIQSPLLNVTFAAKQTGVYVSAIAFSPDSNIVKGTQMVNITATFLNMGTKDAVNFTAITFSVNKVDMTANCGNIMKIPLVKMDNTTTATTYCHWTAPDAAKTMYYNITVEADNGAAPAPGKANMTKQITVIRSPHTVLAITAITFAPTSLKQLNDTGMKQNLTVSIAMANTGDKNATNAALTVVLNGVTFTNNSITILKTSGTATATFTTPVTTAKDASLIWANATLALGTDTVSKGANISLPGHVYRPFYALTAIAASPATQSEVSGKTNMVVNITVSIKNTGDNKDKQTVTVKLTTKLGTAAAVDLTTLTFKGVVAGGTNTTFYLWTVPSTFAVGSYVINAHMDVTPVVADMNMTYKLVVYQAPSLSVDFTKDTKGNVKSMSGSAASGGKVTFNVVVTITNAATATGAANNVQVSLTDASGKVVGTGWYNTSIAPGATGTVTIPIKVNAGKSVKLTANVVSAKGVHADTYTGTASAKPIPISVKQTPGFEVVVLVSAIVVALVILSRRRK